MEQDVTSQIKALEARIQALRSNQLSELQQKLKEARATVLHLEQQIAEIRGGAVKNVTTEGRRKRTSSEEVRGRILKALASNPGGLSQKEISEISELNYNTVVLYLKNHPKDFKTTGTFRSKRYFLK